MKMIFHDTPPNEGLSKSFQNIEIWSSHDNILLFAVLSTTVKALVKRPEIADTFTWFPTTQIYAAHEYDNFIHILFRLLKNGKNGFVSINKCALFRFPVPPG